MKNYKLKISYDGTRYYGWERQPGKDTIQGKIEEVLKKLTNDDSINLIGAGRTDAGVHALSMSANVHLEYNGTPLDLRNYLNEYLPEDISILDVKEASERFHARFLSKGKIYRYTIFDGDVCPVFNRRYYTYIDTKLDEKLMQEAANYLIGEHDFKSFCGNPKMKKSTVREIYNVEIKRSKGYIYLTFEGSGFLQYQVRIMTGTLIEIGQKKRNPEDIITIINGKNRNLAGYTAPPKGLTLVKVKYG